MGSIPIFLIFGWVCSSMVRTFALQAKNNGSIPFKPLIMYVGGVAQLVRALVCQTKDYGCNSRHSRFLTYFNWEYGRLVRYLTVNQANIGSNPIILKYLLYVVIGI